MNKRQYIINLIFYLGVLMGGSYYINLSDFSPMIPLLGWCSAQRKADRLNFYSWDLGFYQGSLALIIIYAIKTRLMLQTFAFSSIDLFVFSGLLVITLGNRIFSFKQISWLSLFYWVWTNLGVWLAYNFYPANCYGLVNCYWRALPFLGREIGKNLFWFCWIFYLQKTENKLSLTVERESGGIGRRAGFRFQ